MLRPRLLPCLIATLLGLGLLWIAWPRGQTANATSPAVSAPAGPFQYQGIASCATSACHNANGPPGSRRSEFTTWAAQDPHARAFAVLYEDRSLRMEQLLKNLPDPKQARPHENALCLSCHVLPNFANAPRSQCFLARDGVACESCHGPAEKWRNHHYSADWKKLTADEKQAQGMTNLGSTQVRAQTCVACHVGAGDADVNHDLIAAGHPRLRFEFATYFANYPRHWAEKPKGDKDHAARDWAVGQVVSGRAAVDLLRHRAADAGMPWPELAEYSCFHCHHDLRDEAWRRQPDAAGRPLGAPAWGTWYFPLLADLTAEQPGRTLPALEKLRQVMGKRSPWRQDVSAAAAAAGKELAEWAGDLGREQKPLPALGLLERLAADQQIVATSHCDGATQTYLALLALQQTLADREPRNRQLPPLQESIRQLGRQLDATFLAETKRFDSPQAFRPAAVSEVLQAIKQAAQPVRRP